MRKLNNYTTFAVVFTGIFIMSNRYNLLPDFIEGLFSGIGILLFLIGMYAYNHDISKLRNCKMNFFKRCLGK